MVHLNEQLSIKPSVWPEAVWHHPQPHFKRPTAHSYLRCWRENDKEIKIKVKRQHNMEEKTLPPELWLPPASVMWNLVSDSLLWLSPHIATCSLSCYCIESPETQAADSGCQILQHHLRSKVKSCGLWPVSTFISEGNRFNKNVSSEVLKENYNKMKKKLNIFRCNKWDTPPGGGHWDIRSLLLEATEEPHSVENILSGSCTQEVTAHYYRPWRPRRNWSLLTSDPWWAITWILYGLPTSLMSVWMTPSSTCSGGCMHTCTLAEHLWGSHTSTSQEPSTPVLSIIFNPCQLYSNTRLLSSSSFGSTGTILHC